MAKVIKIKQSPDLGAGCISDTLVISSFLAEVDTLLSFAQHIGVSGLNLPFGTESSEWLLSASVRDFFRFTLCFLFLER